MVTLTCLTCRCIFVDAALHRSHYKGDWHRYNLKRQVAQLPPVEQAIYEAKANAVQRAPTARTATRCTICAKSFASEQTMRTHEQSKKHKEMVEKNGGSIVEGVDDDDDVAMEEEVFVAALPKTGHNLLIQPKQPMPEDIDQEDSDWESEADSEEKIINEADALPSTMCLFCEHSSSSVETNLAHMHARHSFFVPDVQYCVDVEALLTWMGYKVGVGHECLWCVRPKDFHGVAACRKHMMDKGHCMLRHDTDALIEMQDFYDYSSSYPDATEENADDELPEEGFVLERNYQLVLPSGAAIGHRSLCRYYRQRLRPLTESATGDKAAKSRALVDKLVVVYGGGGVGRGTVAVPTSAQKEMARQRARDLRFVRAVLSKHTTQMDRRRNKNFQFLGRTG